MSSNQSEGVQYLDRQIRLVNSLQQFMRQYAYEMIDLPVIEPADLFLVKAGDQVITKLFTFERNGRQYALRPEFTAAAAERYVRHFGGQAHPVRWQFSGPVFQDEPLKAGQSDQQFNVGAELIGLSGPIADSEVITVAASGLTAHQITDWRLTVGHAGLVRQTLSRFGLDARTQYFLLHYLAALTNPDLGRSYVLDQLDRFLIGRTRPTEHDSLQSDMDADSQTILAALLDNTQPDPINTERGGRTRRDIARRLWQKRQRSSARSQIANALDSLERWAAVSASPQEAFRMIDALLVGTDAVAQHTFSEWRQTIELLYQVDIPADHLRIQPCLARSWDYYTGIVFELHTPTGLHLGGGGRYDELARLIGGEHEAPAVGFAYYLDPILAARPSQPDGQEARVVVVFHSDNMAPAVRCAHLLRQRGIIVQLLPVAIIPERGVIITLLDNYSLRASHSDRTYTFQQIDELTADIKRHTTL